MRAHVCNFKDALPFVCECASPCICLGFGADFFRILAVSMGGGTRAHYYLQKRASDMHRCLSRPARNVLMFEFVVML